MKQYDAIIIGFGKGGKTLTAELAKRGWKVALIERSAMMYGGTCPNILRTHQAAYPRSRKGELALSYRLREAG